MYIFNFVKYMRFCWK